VRRLLWLHLVGYEGLHSARQYADPRTTRVAMLIGQLDETPGRDIVGDWCVAALAGKAGPVLWRMGHEHLPACCVRSRCTK